MQAEQIVWDQALIEKYNYSGPRYTSYPTALEFNEGFGYPDFVQAAGQYPARNLSLYVHIPFCHKLCYYCGCNKVITRHQHKADQYLDYLEQEIKAQAPLFKERLVTQLHWGGGTPTYLSEPQTRRLMAMLREHFHFAEEGEISIEVDPREIELSMLDVLRELGFNRISLGVQDFNKAVQVAVNREQDNDFIRAMLVRARELGSAPPIWISSTVCRTRTGRASITPWKRCSRPTRPASPSSTMPTCRAVLPPSTS